MDDRRYYGLDALRGCMMMLGIVLHAGMLYMSTPPPAMPVPVDPNNSPILLPLFYLIHSFRMPTFFLLAGFFTSLLVEKRGIGGTYKNRMARVLAPLVVGTFTVVPVATLFYLDFMLSARFGTHDILPNLANARTLGLEVAQKLAEQGIALRTPGPGHLWFLYYLCLFYLLIPICRLLVKLTLPSQDRISKLLASPYMLLVFGLYTSATLWPFHGGQMAEGFTNLVPHPPSLLYYGSFFVIGYLFHFYRGVLHTFVRCVPAAALLSLVLFPLSLYCSDLDNAARGASFATHFAAVLSNGLCTWSLAYLFIGGALKWFDYESPWILYASQSSYWVFMLHLPVVCFAGWVLVQYDLPALLKFLAVMVFTSLVCFSTYHYWVQRTWVSVFLNGRRFELAWPWRKPASAAAKATK